MNIYNKYQNGKIYKITDIGYNKCYIGSTTEELNQRMARHRTDYKRFLNGKNRHTRSYDIFDEYGVENCKIELVEYFKCDTLQQLQRKEGEHIKNTECVNKNIAGRTIKEWWKDNKNKMQLYQKEYYKANKNKIKEYYEANKNKINKRFKEYYKNNKQYFKEYYENNKNKI